MAKKLSATERLAIDICWKGFNDPSNTGYRSKFQYWKSVGPNAKKAYLDHAAEMIWWARRLGADRLGAAVTEHDAAQ